MFTQFEEISCVLFCSMRVLSRLQRYFERDTLKGINRVNEILRIGGLPVKARLVTTKNWEIVQRKEGKHIWFSAKRSAKDELFEVQQTFVRDEFFSVKTPDEAAAFFRKFGPFQREEGASYRSSTESAIKVQFAALLKYQEWWTEFIKTPSPECFTEWLGMHEFMVFQIAPKPNFTAEMGHVRKGSTKYPSPYLRQYSYDVATAIHNSIYIEKMAGLRGAICERCEKVFLSNSDRPRRFCTRKCADSARQSAWRKDKRLRAKEENHGKA
jgi:hypothetical protein